jgi:hypothetical protein
MTRYQAGNYEDFKRLMNDLVMVRIFYSRKSDTVAIPDKPDPKAPDVKVTKTILVGYVLLCGENGKGDTLRFYDHFNFPTDKSEKSYKEIGDKILAIEMKVIQDMENLPCPPAQYSGEIKEEEKRDKA